VRVASIVAFGGVGKSALVNAWLARMDADGWRGAERVYGWSFYSQGTDRLTSSDEFVDAALRWFGDPEPEKGSAWDKGERLAAMVREKRTILVLDGLEPLQWGPGVEAGKLKDPTLQALIKELGAQNMGFCLITTRIAVADLDGFGGDKVQAYDLDHLSAEAGAKILRARGAKGLVGELRSASDEYRGHSFSLTLLGSYLRTAHKGDIRKRDLIPPLEGKPARRMMATYDLWFKDKPELAILRILGLFDRPAPEGELAAVRQAPAIEGLTDVLEGLPRSRWNEAVTALRDVGLLAGGSETEEAETLDAHPLVREHFGEQLRREQPEAWREGHRRLYVYLKGKAKELPDTIEEMAPLYAAVVHGCMAGKNQEALDEVHWKRIKRENAHFSTKKLGAFGSEVAILSAFFDPPWERLAPGLSEPDQAFILNLAGVALRALGRMPEATGLTRMALDLRIAWENWKGAARVAFNLSELLMSCGELPEALEQARKSVEFADRGGDAFDRACNRSFLAAALHATNLRDEAAAQFEEAERLENNGLLYSIDCFRYCDLLLDQGLGAEVSKRAVQDLKRAKDNHWLLDTALDHLSLGRAHLLAAQRGAVSDLAEAASHLAASVDGLRRAGQRDMLPLGLLARAALRTHTGAFALARRDLDEALTLAQRCGFRLHEADAHLSLARLSLAEGSPDTARDHLAKARTIIDATGYHRRDPDLAELLALLA
jgi:tetratricopeptide (TPR) repeat protein